MMDQLMNYLGTNGGLLVILCLVMGVHLSGACLRQLTEQRQKAPHQCNPKNSEDKVRIAIRNLPPRMSNLHFPEGGR